VVEITRVDLGLDGNKILNWMGRELLSTASDSAQLHALANALMVFVKFNRSWTYLKKIYHRFLPIPSNVSVHHIAIGYHRSIAYSDKRTIVKYY
jgi:hypothetical protein